MNPLAAHIQSTLEGPEAFPMTLPDYDWSEQNSDGVGISDKYVIAMTARSGSTWLAHLLQSTGVCGNPKELFNAEALAVDKMKPRPGDFSEIFAHQVSKYSSDGAFGFETNFERFNHLLDLVDFESVFLDQGTRFVYLTRTDLLSQAISVLSALRTGVWHRFLKRSGNEQSACGELDEQTLWHWILSFVQEERRWETFFNRHQIMPLKVTYEELVTNPRLQLARILKHIRPGKFDDYGDLDRLLGNLSSGTEKLQRQSTERAWVNFRFKFADELHELERLRTAVDGTELAIHINKKYGLQVGIAP